MAKSQEQPIIKHSEETVYYRPNKGIKKLATAVIVTAGILVPRAWVAAQEDQRTRVNEARIQAAEETLEQARDTDLYLEMIEQGVPESLADSLAQDRLVECNDTKGYVGLETTAENPLIWDIAEKYKPEGMSTSEFSEYIVWLTKAEYGEKGEEFNPNRMAPRSVVYVPMSHTEEIAHCIANL